MRILTHVMHWQAIGVFKLALAALLGTSLGTRALTSADQLPAAVTGALRRYFSKWANTLGHESRSASA
jgi:hypothetical protein